MLYTLPQFIVFLAHTIVLVLAYFFGAWINKKTENAGEGKQKRKPGTMIIEGTLLSFLLGFTFNAAFDKYVSRRNIFSDEINNISSVYAIASLYPDSIKQEFTSTLNKYVSSRIAYYEAGDNNDKIKNELKNADADSKKILKLLANYENFQHINYYPREMIPALNKMFDITATREMLRNARVPLPALKLLLLISVLVIFLAGIKGGFTKADWFTAIGFSLLISMTLYLILDLDTSRKGQITLDDEQIRLIEFYDAHK